MNTHRAFTGSRWTVRVSAVIGMVLLPACSTPSAFTPEPAHVFSARSPQELESESGSLGIPVRAQYPQSAASSDSDQLNSASYTAPSELPESFAAFAAMQQEKDQAVRTASWSSEDQKNPFQFASYRPDDAFGTSAASEGIVRTSFRASEARRPTDPSTPPSNQMETVAAGPMPDVFHDEYVFDGGDRDLPLHYNAGDRMGLDTEDTVAEFEDHTGTYRVKPSNRVAVYSPRFGSVRTVTGLETDVKIDRAVGARDSIGAGSLNSGSKGEASIRNTAVVGLEVRQRADGMETALPPSQSASADHAMLSRKVDKGHEDRKYTNAGQLGKLDTPIISERVQNAVIWTRSLFPQITVTTTNAGEITAHFKPQQTVGVEDERQTKGDLRIVKLADRSTAQPGDVVTFTIQVQNVGDFDVYDVRIVDNLTPRLQYIEGSASIAEQTPGEVTADSNGEGSQILTFTLDNPLKGHSGTVITFETRVR